MAKKIYARARLVKGDRWLIDYTTFDPDTKQEQRHRKDFDLNDIPDLHIRELVAERIISSLSAFIQSAGPAKSEPGTSVADAVAMAREIKFRLPRKNSHSHYRTVSRRFLLWASARKYSSLPVRDFSKKYAREYWDYLTANKYAGRTLNNYLAGLKALWSEMKEREMVPVNIWDNIKPARVGEKRRRPFTDEEKNVVAAWAKENDYWMFRGILLQYFCFIRPVEISRMKFKDFNFANGTVCVLAGNAKSWKKRVATIPLDVLHFFIDGTFDKFPANYFVLGRIPARNGRWEMWPSTTALAETRMNLRHGRALRRLKAAGLLRDITGLSWYSWKDTGISSHTRKTSPLSTKDQAGHTDLSVTSLYYHHDEINQEYKLLKNDLLL